MNAMRMLPENVAQLRNQPPVIVGCVGGSGSRVVAEVLHRSGCFMGKNLNHACDNMDFAYCLVGRRAWLRKKFPFEGGDAGARAAIDLFEKLYFKEPLSLADKWRFVRIGLGYLRPSAMRLLRTRTAGQRTGNAAGLLGGRRGALGVEGIDFSGWGFKLPGSMLMLNVLLDAYPEMKFVHVVRDGRDMALSGNQKMMTHYAALFGIEQAYSLERSFELWRRMNTWACELYSRRMTARNVLVMQFESLCRDPREQIDRLVAFAGLPAVSDESIYAIPRVIDSIGRWRPQAERFESLDRQVLERFGYEVGPGPKNGVNE